MERPPKPVLLEVEVEIHEVGGDEVVVISPAHAFTRNVVEQAAYTEKLEQAPCWKDED